MSVVLSVCGDVTGLDEGSLDSLTYDSLISTSQLQTYIRLVSSVQACIRLVILFEYKPFIQLLYYICIELFLVDFHELWLCGYVCYVVIHFSD